MNNKTLKSVIVVIPTEKESVTCSVRASDSSRMAFALASALAKTAWASPGGSKVTN